jgi:hypothetical protein
MLSKAQQLLLPQHQVCFLHFALFDTRLTLCIAAGIDRRVGKRVREDPHSIAGSPECWFCLQNPDCDTTLVVSVGRDFYLAL